MKWRKVVLRCSCVVLALVCIILTARLGAETAVGLVGSTPGRTASGAAIGITAALSIWMAKLAGPWRI
jgi:hypothetical protein